MSTDMDIAMTMNRKNRRRIGKKNGVKIRGVNQPIIKIKKI